MAEDGPEYPLVDLTCIRRLITDPYYDENSNRATKSASEVLYHPSRKERLKNHTFFTETSSPTSRHPSTEILLHHRACHYGIPRIELRFNAHLPISCSVRYVAPVIKRISAAWGIYLDAAVATIRRHQSAQTFSSNHLFLFPFPGCRAYSPFHANLVQPTLLCWQLSYCGQGSNGHDPGSGGIRH
jgi:hypothetical protein